METMNKTIVGIGEILWDIFLDRKVLGGAPANFAYHATQLGFNGYALSAIGNDVLGEEIIRSLKEKKLNYLVQKTEYPTGTVQVTLSGDGIPQYEICENVAWDNISFTEQTDRLAKQCVAVCFGSLAQRSKTSRETIRRFLQATPESCLKIFDINLRQHFYSQDVIEESLAVADILKINEDEIKTVAEMFQLKARSEKEICQSLLVHFELQMVILTKGTDGSYIFTTNEASYLPTPKVEVADTVGAGDSFTAAFVTAFLSNKSIQESHRIAVEVSAYVCQQYGAMPALRQNIIELIK